MLIIWNQEVWNPNFLTLGSWSLQSWCSYVHLNAKSWLWYSWDLWLTLWALTGSQNPNLGSIGLGSWLWSLTLGLRSLIYWFSSWNPNHGHLVLVDHVGLTFGLVMDWNPKSLKCGPWPPYHASSIIKFVLFMEIIHQVCHLTYMSTCLGIHLIHILVQAAIHVLSI